MLRTLTLTLVWLVLDLLLLAAASLSIILSSVWKHSDLVVSLVFLPRHYGVALALGILLALSFFLSIPAITSPPYKPLLLRLLFASLVLDTLFATGAGTCVWLFSLRQREEYAGLWEALNYERKGGLERMFNCCGYYNSTPSGLFTPPPPSSSDSTAFCTDPSFASLQQGCVGPMGTYFDQVLEETFSTMYGFVCITIAFGLATACILNERQLVVRFRKIDMKRGGSGFV